MELLEAQLVTSDMIEQYHGLECKKRKRDDIESPTQHPRLTKKQRDEVFEVLKKLGDDAIRKQVWDTFSTCGTVERPVINISIRYY